MGRQNAAVSSILLIILVVIMCVLSCIVLYSVQMLFRSLAHVQHHHLSVASGTHYPACLGRAEGVEEHVIIRRELLARSVERVGHYGA